ncbi:hypothetical protein OUZ56_017310 [Daphnia magna]|uniref:Uncharacterized protein n=1 Tax=Daphnia magna TaxID=35525 RepID=A0ABR0ASN7_9CRUS|nr:hypothetical protein OUZ56_017310 [Daphnia magna]
MRQMGCKSSKEDLIRGHFRPIADLRQTFTLLAAYIFIQQEIPNAPLVKKNQKKPIRISLEAPTASSQEVL